MPRQLNGETRVSAIVLGQVDFTCKRIKLGPSHHTQKLTRISNQYVRPNTVKLLKENTEENLCDLGLDSGFLRCDTKNKSNKRKNK